MDVGFDLRSGFDFDAVAAGDYRSACPKLKQLWAKWREVLPRYGFGRFQVVPVMGGAGGIAKYLGKSLEARKPEHEGFRLVRSSKGALWKRCSATFSWISAGSHRWRACLKAWFLAK